LYKGEKLERLESLPFGNSGILCVRRSFIALSEINLGDHLVIELIPLSRANELVRFVVLVDKQPLNRPT
jgi:hypothetical protein